MPAHPHTLYNSIDPRSEEEKQSEFLANFAQEESVVAAAAAARVSVSRVKQWRLRDTNFEMAFNEMAETILLKAEEELYQRAVVGEMTPVFQGGKEVGKVRKKSDILLMFFLKTNMPDKYNKGDDPKDPNKPKDAVVLTLPSNGREILNQPPAQIPIMPDISNMPISEQKNNNKES